MWVRACVQESVCEGVFVCVCVCVCVCVYARADSINLLCELVSCMILLPLGEAGPLLSGPDTPSEVSSCTYRPRYIYATLLGRPGDSNSLASKGKTFFRCTASISLCIFFFWSSSSLIEAVWMSFIGQRKSVILAKLLPTSATGQSTSLAKMLWKPLQKTFWHAYFLSMGKISLIPCPELSSGNSVKTWSNFSV